MMSGPASVSADLRSPRDAARPAAPAPVAARTWREKLALLFSGWFGPRYDGLRNFCVVRPGVLMRCGQPRVSDLEQIRRQHGLRTIFCARGGTRHPLRGRWFGLEKRFCEKYGIRFEHVPFSDSATPPSDIFDRFLALLREPANLPVLVHCEQGYHRTGILAAVYRIGVEGWSLEDAIAEMDERGFESHRAKRAPLRDALRAWAVARGRGARGE
jgi:protein tyrosine/serine phosphatase